MKLEAHQQRLRESIQVIEECIEKGIIERQRNIGFNTSAAAIDMLEMLLHTENCIDHGMVIKHDWFTSERKVKEKLSFDFSSKQEITRLICAIEAKRNILCYGKTQKAETLQELIKDFNVLRNIFKGLGINESTESQ